MLRKIIFVFIFLSLFFVFLSKKNSWAANYNYSFDPSSPLVLGRDTGNQIKLTINSNDDLFLTDKKYGLQLIAPNGRSYHARGAPFVPSNKRIIILNFGLPVLNDFQELGHYQFKAWISPYDVFSSGDFADNLVVATGGFEIVASQQFGTPTIKPKQPQYQIGNKAQFIIENFEPNQDYTFWWEGYRFSADVNARAPNNSSAPFEITSNAVINTPGTYKYCMEIGNLPNVFAANCRFSTSVEYLAVPPPPGGGGSACANLPPAQKIACDACVANNQIYTALGCVFTKPEDFVGQLLGWVMGLGGGLAFLLIVYGGFEIVTSTGDPEKLNAGKEIIVSALTGLLMIIFSVVLLHIIGVNILQIPGL